LEVTAPDEFAAAIRIGDKPICLAATTCKLPKRELADVSLPDKKQASQPSHTERKGNAFPTLDRVNPTVYAIPISPRNEAVRNNVHNKAAD
jgi:hypothetical protein